MDFQTILSLIFAAIGLFCVWLYLEKKKELKELLNNIRKEEDEFEIKEIRVCPNDFNKDEKEKEINKILASIVGLEKILKREVKEDGYLYITIRINKINKLHREKIYYLLAAIFIFALAFWTFNYTGSSTNKKVVSKSNDTFKEILAYNYCKDWVKDRLKTPSTADFPFTPLKVTKIDGNYYVYSYVDAQNSFGAQIRTKFICVTKCNEHSCLLVNLQFEK